MAELFEKLTERRPRRVGLRSLPFDDLPEKLEVMVRVDVRNVHPEVDLGEIDASFGESASEQRRVHVCEQGDDDVGVGGIGPDLHQVVDRRKDRIVCHAAWIDGEG